MMKAPHGAWPASVPLRVVHSSTLTGARAKAWCLLIHAEACLSISLVHFATQPETFLSLAD